MSPAGSSFACGRHRTTPARSSCSRPRKPRSDPSSPLIERAAKADRLTWVAYPKAGQLDTDLNRDRLAAHLASRGIRAVRNVALDDVWSALRFRPG